MTFLKIYFRFHMSDVVINKPGVYPGICSDPDPPVFGEIGDSIYHINYK